MQQNFGTKRNHVQIEILSTWQQQLIIVCSSKRWKLALGWIIHSYYNNVHPQPWCNYLLWVIGSHGRCPLIWEGKRQPFQPFQELSFLEKDTTFFFTFWTLNGFSHVVMINTLTGLSPICLFQFSSVSKQGLNIKKVERGESYSISVECMLYDCRSWSLPNRLVH